MERKYERLGSRYSKIFICIVALIFVISATLFLLSGRPMAHRVSVLVVADPLLVVSWEPRENHFHIIEIPPNVQFDALYGYGRYSADSLWQLGRIDKRGGKLLAGSIEELLAIPIDGYIGPRGSSIPRVTPDSTTYTRQIFSLRTIVENLQRRGENTLGFFQFWSLTRALSLSRSDQVTVLSLNTPRVLREEILPDESRVNTVDVLGVDNVLGDNFENSEIRREAIRVSILNTTTLPSLAGGAARFLSRAGVLVIAVGNDDKRVSECILSGKQEYLETTTARFVTNLFHCKHEKLVDDTPVDLFVKIGSDWEARFKR